MALSDLAAAARNDQAPAGTCAVCHALTTIPPGEAAALRDLLANPAKRYSDLESDLANDPDTPLLIDWQALSRHARGRCAAREKLR